MGDGCLFPAYAELNRNSGRIKIYSYSVLRICVDIPTHAGAFLPLFADFMSMDSLPNAPALLSGTNSGNSTTCVAYRVVWLVGARKRRGRSVRIVRLIPVASRKTFRKRPKPV